jgi:hypothetical protein
MINLKEPMRVFIDVVVAFVVAALMFGLGFFLSHVCLLRGGP